MILQEKTVHEEAAAIQTYVVNKINSTDSISGKFKVTKQFNKFFKGNKIPIYVHYNLNSKENIFLTTGDENSLVIKIFAKNNLSPKTIVTYINHEIIHAITHLQSETKVMLSTKKNYDKFIKKGDISHHLAYVKNRNELNVIINQIKAKYDKNKYFRDNINKSETLDEMMDFIYRYLGLGYLNTHVKKDVDFRKIFLKRLVREGIPLKFYKKQMFVDAVKETK